MGLSQIEAGFLDHESPMVENPFEEDKLPQQDFFEVKISNLNP